MEQVALFIQQLINGLSTGSVYGSSAVAYALIYSVFGFSNFVHGEFTMVGAYAAFFAIALYALPFPLAVLVGMALSALVAVGVERTAYRPLRKKNATALYFFVSAMGFSILLQNLGIVAFSATFRTFSFKLPVETLNIGAFSLRTIDLFTFVLALISVLVLERFLKLTRTGRAIKAIAYDRYAAELMGINIDRTSIAVFLLAGALAGLSGILRGVSYTIYPTMGLLVVKIWVCAILGGLGSIAGAFIGGLLVGTMEALVSGYFSSSYRDVFTFALLILVLLVRPSGLMGKKVENKT